MKIYNLNKLTAKNVSDFWGNDVLSGRNPTGIQAYSFKLKKFFIFLEENGFINQENLYLAILKKLQDIGFNSNNYVRRC